MSGSIVGGLAGAIIGGAATGFVNPAGYYYGYAIGPASGAIIDPTEQDERDDDTQRLD